MKSLRILSVMAFLLSFITITALAEITGRVVGRNGVPQNSVQVQFHGPGKYLSITRADGEFYLEDPEDGNYKVIVISGGRQHIFHGAVIVKGEIKPNEFVVPW
ncbi:MAG: hypothetical protein HGJ94_10350 [Desulfosarcina sp.]|nr:hypothetical protein [Desulfosarcina sp.]